MVSFSQQTLDSLGFVQVNGELRWACFGPGDGDDIVTMVTMVTRMM